jgi:glycine/D-amino acid oxidase-like deaminating enzyme
VTKKVKVSIIGCGIAGVMIALKLQQVGFQVTVFGEDCVENSQSWYSQGILHRGAKYLDLDGEHPLRRSLESAWAGWAPLLGTALNYPTDQGEVAHVQYVFQGTSFDLDSAHSRFLRSGLCLSTCKTSNSSSLLKPDCIAYLSDEIQIDARRLHARFCALALDVGCEFSTRARKIERDFDQWLVWCSNLNVFDYLILAAGAGTAQVGEMIGTRFHVKRRSTRVSIVEGVRVPITSHLFRSKDVRPWLTVTSKIGLSGSVVWQIGGTHQDDLTRSREAVISSLAEFFSNDVLCDAVVTDHVDIDRIELDDGSSDISNSYILRSGRNESLVLPTKMALLPLLVEQLARELDLRFALSSETTCRTL